MLNGGWGSVLSHRNEFLEALHAVDPDALTPEALGAELKLIRSTVDLLELEAARRVASFDSRHAYAATIPWSPRADTVCTPPHSGEFELTRRIGSGH